MNSLFSDMLSKHLIEVEARPKDGDLLVAIDRELFERRHRLGRAMMAFMEVETYNPPWYYWLEYAKINMC